jgi:hypothetical protein
VIQKVGEHEIRHTSKGLNVENNVGDDVLIELIARAAERFQGSLNAYGSDDFQLRLARVAGANHLAVSFVDPAIEKARAAAPPPLNKAALEYVTERNSKREWIAGIPFHRMWRAEDAGELTFVGLRVIAQQDFLIASNGTKIWSCQLRQSNELTWRGTNASFRSQKMARKQRDLLHV